MHIVEEFFSNIDFRLRLETDLSLNLNVKRNTLTYPLQTWTKKFFCFRQKEVLVQTLILVRFWSILHQNAHLDGK